MKGCGRASESLFFFLMGYILHMLLYWWKWHGKEEETVEKPRGDDESITLSRERKLCKEHRHCFQSNNMERQSRQKTGMRVVQFTDLVWKSEIIFHSV